MNGLEKKLTSGKNMLRESEASSSLLKMYRIPSQDLIHLPMTGDNCILSLFLLKKKLCSIPRHSLPSIAESLRLVSACT
jgi:hypothetical protein